MGNMTAVRLIVRSLGVADTKFTVELGHYELGKVLARAVRVRMLEKLIVVRLWVAESSRTGRAGARVDHSRREWQALRGPLEQLGELLDLARCQQRPRPSRTILTSM